MTFLQLLGSVIVALPFVGFGVHIVREDGWDAFAFVFGVTFGLAALFMLGAFLIVGGAR